MIKNFKNLLNWDEYRTALLYEKLFYNYYYNK